MRINKERKKERRYQSNFFVLVPYDLLQDVARSVTLVL